MNPSELTTVIIPTSPSPKHPSTQLLEDAIDSIRKHLPGVRCIVQCDGVAPVNENRRVAYEAYKRRIDLLAANKYDNISVLKFPEYTHQAEMMRATFPFIGTPLILFFEHDWILLPEPIDWEAMCRAVLSGELNQIRLCRWDEIHPEHEHLMCGRVEFSDCPVVKTIQWSGHPAFISTEFMKRIIGMFRVGCRTLIEEFIYGPVATNPWEEFRCSVYRPSGSMRRIHHTDGRESDPKMVAEF